MSLSFNLNAMLLQIKQLKLYSTCGKGLGILLSQHLVTLLWQISQLANDGLQDIPKATVCIS